MKLVNIFLRYALLVVVLLIGFQLFYYIFLPLTLYPSYWILDIFFDASLSGDIIKIGSLSIEIIGACVAGGAYSFLLILNLATPRIDLRKRIKILLFSFGIFLVANIFRIVILTFIYIFTQSIYDFSHRFFWYFGSTVFVVLIWFWAVNRFKIEEIPFYSDIKLFYSKSLFKK